MSELVLVRLQALSLAKRVCQMSSSEEERELISV